MPNRLGLNIGGGLEFAVEQELEQTAPK